MMKKKLVIAGLAVAAAAVFAKDFEMSAPMQTKTGKHHAAACVDKTNGELIGWNTAETTVVWRLFGANTFEFNDMVTRQPRVLKEAGMDRYQCRTLKLF